MEILGFTSAVFMQKNIKKREDVLSSRHNSEAQDFHYWSAFLEISYQFTFISL